MKRKPHPDNPHSTFGPRAKPMRRRSLKQAKAYRDHAEERAAFVRTVWLCDCCHKRPATDCHKMTSGANGMLGFGDRRCWLRVCSKCNCFELTDRAKWPLARQLAVKQEVDPKFYDLRFVVVTVCGLAATAITQADVDSWRERL